MQRKIGIQLRGSGRALKPRGPGVMRPKPQDRYGQPFKPKPIRPGKKEGGRAGTEEGQRRAKPKSRKLGRGIGGKSFTRDLLKGADNLRKVKVGDLTIAFKDGGKAKKFPDLTGDGKVTRADILKGRGVFAAGGKVKNKILKEMFKVQKEYFKIPGKVRKEMKRNKKGKQ